MTDGRSSRRNSHTAYSHNTCSTTSFEKCPIIEAMTVYFVFRIEKSGSYRLRPMRLIGFDMKIHRLNKKLPLSFIC